MSKGTILIVGGAGYIGAHANALLSESGYDAITLDNLVYGHEEFVQWGTFVEGDLADAEILRSIFTHHTIDAVFHFAGYTYVGESVTDPAKFYHNNVACTLNLLQAMREFSVNRFIFSSTCATYGEPQYMPLDEAHPQAPVNPYGHTKHMVENILHDFGHAYGLQYIILRYFNAAGADPQTRIGEWHVPESHLIPLILDAALDPEKSIRIFGTDYDTPDGTCIRDYIHVNDLAQAHIKAHQHLHSGGDSGAYNLGNGQGYSVREVIDTVRRVTGREINIIEDERRPGDPRVLYGSSEKAKIELGWDPQFADLDTIVETAWKWHQKQFG